VREFTLEPENRVPYLAFQSHSLSDEPVVGMEAVDTAYYLRLEAQDEPGVLAEVTGVLSQAGISIEAVIQKQPAPGAETVPVILLTHRVRESKMDAACQAIEALDAVHGSLVRIRVETLA